jgi:hypothetical protein
MNQSDLEHNIEFCHKHEVYLRHGYIGKELIDYCTLSLPEYHDCVRCRYRDAVAKMVSQRVKGSMLTVGEYYRCRKNG